MLLFVSLDAAENITVEYADLIDEIEEMNDTLNRANSKLLYVE